MIKDNPDKRPTVPGLQKYVNLMLTDVLFVDLWQVLVVKHMLSGTLRVITTVFVYLYIQFILDFRKLLNETELQCLNI